MWPRPLALQWSKQYTELFDADDVRLARAQPSNQFAEWFAAIHLFQRDGVLALIENYIFGAHAEKRRRITEIQKGLLEQLQDIKKSLGVQPPDLLLLARQDVLWFCRIQGAGGS